MEFVFLKCRETVQIEVRRGIRGVVRVEAELGFPGIRDAIVIGIGIGISGRIVEEAAGGIGSGRIGGGGRFNCLGWVVRGFRVIREG